MIQKFDKGTTVPIVVEQTGRGERSYDIFSRLLIDRIVYLGEDVNSATASVIIAELLFLEAQDPDKDIYFYINSPGGSVSDGLAIYDTMNYIKCDVSTICVGMAASMGAVLLAAGTRGKRFALENSQVMIHQVLGGVEGQATDMEIEAAQILRIRERINGLLAKDTGTDIEIISHDTLRNKWLFADEAVRYGLVDFIIPNAR